MFDQLYGRQGYKIVYRIPKVSTHYGEYELELSQRLRKVFLGRKNSASLLNAQTDMHVPCTSQRVNLQSLYSESDPDWLPSLILIGVCKKINKK